VARGHNYLTVVCDLEIYSHCEGLDLYPHPTH